MSAAATLGSLVKLRPAPAYWPSAHRSAVATVSVIARQKVAASERNQPKSLSTISKRTSAADVVDQAGGKAELGEGVAQVMRDAEAAPLAETINGLRPREQIDRPVEIAPVDGFAEPRDRGRRRVGEAHEQVGRIAAVAGALVQGLEPLGIVRPAVAQAGAEQR
jgi:hypothetical protein